MRWRRQAAAVEHRRRADRRPRTNHHLSDARFHHRGLRSKPERARDSGPLVRRIGMDPARWARLGCAARHLLRAKPATGRRVRLDQPPSTSEVDRRRPAGISRGLPGCKAPSRAGVDRLRDRRSHDLSHGAVRRRRGLAGEKGGEGGDRELGKPPRRRPVGHEATELVSVVGDETVEPLDRSGGMRGRSRHGGMAQGLQQLDPRCSARRDQCAGPREVPGREPLGLGQRCEQPLARGILEWQQRDAVAPVDCSDDTRREAAQPSAAVVHQHGSPRLHGHHPRLRR